MTGPGRKTVSPHRGDLGGRSEKSIGKRTVSRIHTRSGGIAKLKGSSLLSTSYRGKYPTTASKDIIIIKTKSQHEI
jgi:hypothetical protein